MFSYYFFLQCIICSARTHVLKMLGLAITKYTSLMVTVKISHGYKFRVGFMNQEDHYFFLWPNLDKLSQVLRTESWHTNVDGNSRTWSHFHCDLPRRRRSNCSSMLVLYLVRACCLDYFLIHLFCLTNHNLTLEVATICDSFSHVDATSY